MTLYKLTAADGGPLHGGTGNWPLPTATTPGEWRSVHGRIEPCVNGLHLLERADIPYWLREGVLWEAEPAPRTATVRHEHKTVVRKARLVRRVATIDRHLLVTFATDCAERVLPIFEARFPKDDRPRKAIEMLRRWLAGTATEAELRANAANAAANAAYAAAYAAYAAADAANAAYAAAYAASAAAYAYASAAAERHWQADRLAELLGLPA